MSFLSYAGADAVVAACQAVTRVHEPVGTLHLVAARDFGMLNNHLELRVLGEFGFGGKLRVEHRSSVWRVFADAYSEDEASGRFRATLSRLNDDLAEIAETLVFEPEGWCQRSSDGLTHLILPGTADDPDAVYRPVCCGDGVTAPGAPAVEVPTCMRCRVSRAVGAERWVFLHDMERLLGEVSVMRTFPSSRRGFVVEQRSRIDAVLVSPRAGIAAAAAAGSRVFGRVGMPPAGLVDRFDAYTRWEMGVFRAHGAEYTVRFPMKRQMLELIERGVSLLSPEVPNV